VARRRLRTGFFEATTGGKNADWHYWHWRDGGTIARRLRERGHSVRVANSRGPEAVKQFADEIGADAADIYGP